MLRNLFLLVLIVALSSSLHGQNSVPNYQFKLSLDSKENQLHIKQKITFTNTEDSELNHLYLNDWANAYSSTKSALADRLVEEYNRSFYLSKKAKRGKTIINSISTNHSFVKWQREPEQVDIIKIELEEPLNPQEEMILDLDYVIHLPDARFTGYGIVTKETYLLENFFVTLAERTAGEWIKQSHLDLEDSPMGASNIICTLIAPKELAVHSNLDAQDIIHANDNIIHRFSAKAKRKILFHIGKDIAYETFSLTNKKIKTNIDLDGLDKEKTKLSLTKIDDFLEKALGKYTHQNVLLSKEKYNKRPFYGLTLVPGFLKLFPAQFEFELKALNTYLYDYLSEVLPLESREDYWLFGGLQTYLMTQYVKENYADTKLLESFMRQPLIRFLTEKYRFTDLSFEDTFLEFHEYILRKNLQQELFRPKDELIRFNDQIGQPSHMGKVLNYFIENNSIELSPFIAKIKREQLTGAALKIAFFDHFGLNATGDFSRYFSSRSSVDLSFAKFKKQDSILSFQIKEKSNYSLPFSLGWIRNDSLIKTERFEGNTIGETIRRAKLDADYLVINPVNKFPELNPRNNVKQLGLLGIKPIRFTFLKDFENTSYNQLFYRPEVNFNVYDGISYGIGINNSTIKRRPFFFSIDPFYSPVNKQLVGYFSTSYNAFNQESSYYLKSVGFSGSSFHYDENLRYTIFSGSAFIAKRPNNLRENRKEILQLFWQSVDREENIDQIQNPNYKIAGLRYIFSNKNALNYFTMSSNLEAGSKFGKFSLKADYRHLTNSGRQFSLRFFAGKFLWKNNLNTDYFNFALDRPTDYLFQYNYLGRSETTGIYSQQYIPAEGGFKTKFENPLANNYLITANTSMGIWKWIEAYGDIGFIKHDDSPSRILFDTGIRFNFLPDYLEVYFPIYNSAGLEVDQHNYAQKIRFVLTLDRVTLTQLFSRKWF